MTCKDCQPADWRGREARRLLVREIRSAVETWRTTAQEHRKGTLPDFVLEAIAQLREYVAAKEGFVIHADEVELSWSPLKEVDYDEARNDGWEVGEALVESDLGLLCVVFRFRTYKLPKQSKLPTTSTPGPSAHHAPEISTSVDTVSLLKRSDKDDWQGPKDMG